MGLETAETDLALLSPPFCCVSKRDGCAQAVWLAQSAFTLHSSGALHHMTETA